MHVEGSVRFGDNSNAGPILEASMLIICDFFDGIHHPWSQMALAPFTCGKPTNDVSFHDLTPGIPLVFGFNLEKRTDGLAHVYTILWH
jgi:hypothetical protein